VWQARIERSSYYIFKLTYYTASSVWAYWLFYRTDCLPNWMGGVGSLKNHFSDFPYKPQVPGLLAYSLVQLGYFIEDVIEHNFIKERANDFWEMNLHHLMTIAMFGGMILTNSIIPGAFVSFLHNVSDILMTLSRIFSNTVFKKLTYATFIMAILVWIITRNIILPIVSYECWKGLIYPSELS
jgi:hypothetical protein